MQLSSLERLHSNSNTLDGKHSKVSFGVISTSAKTAETTTNVVEARLDQADLSPNFLHKVLSMLQEVSEGDDFCVDIDAFEKIAKAAQQVANSGNVKPKILVESMAAYINKVETLKKEGVSVSQACQMAKDIPLEVCLAYNKGNRSTAFCFSQRWDYLAAQTGRGDKQLMESIVPEENMPKTFLAIKLDGVDNRDMLEFLRKHWRYGNKAYRVLQHGRGLMGYLSYWREELLPDYWACDKFLRKH